jgi:alpha-L-fucosidase
MPNTIIANRFLIQEAISTHSQRIEEHALDVMIEGKWVEVAAGTTVGYKKILRFPTIQTNKFRIRILKSRLQPTLSKVSAHFYKSRPPQIQISRDKMGMVTLSPEKHQFMWKSHGLNPMENLNTDLKIHFTTDGSEPTIKSDVYTAPFFLASGEIRVVAFEHDLAGGETSNRFGLLKNNWKLIKVSSLQKTREGESAFDSDTDTYWQSKENANLPQYICIDLGDTQSLKGFAYTPQTEIKEGMIESGSFFVSSNGKKWDKIESFEFGNLINDPTKRTYIFKDPVITRYIKIQADRGAGGSQIAAIAELDFFE